MNRPLRVLVALVVVCLLVVALFTVVFPWIDRTFVNDPTMGAPASGTHAGPS